MQCLSYPRALALLHGAKYNLKNRLIDLSKISDNEIYTQALENNREIQRTAQVIADFEKHALYNTKLNLELIEDSSLKEAILRIDKDGILRVTPAFWLTTDLKKGMEFRPGKNTDDPTDHGIYFVQSPTGVKLEGRGFNLLPILEAWHIPYPTRVLWDYIPDKRALRLEFP